MTILFVSIELLIVPSKPYSFMLVDMLTLNQFFMS